MHTPGWILTILCSYLSSRSLVLTYQKKTSTKQDLPGGHGAGTWLGGFLFIIKFNGICLGPPIPSPNGNMAIQLKFLDDSTKAASINIKRSLVPDPETKPFPINYHERTQMVLDPSENLLQMELDRFNKEGVENNFVANKKKTFVMVFNPTKNYAFFTNIQVRILRDTTSNKLP